MDQLPKRPRLATRKQPGGPPVTATPAIAVTPGGAVAASQPLVLSDLIGGTLVRDTALVVGGAGLVGLLAQLSIHIPGTPVPVTGQTLGVLLVGAALGWRRGLAALMLYLLAGLAGVPWYASGESGYVGASFGYIPGFVAAAGVTGWLAGRGADRKLASSVGAMIAGEVVMYAIGVAWLAVYLHVSIGHAIVLGFVPFWIGDALKCALAAGLLPSAWRLAERRGA